MLDLVIISGASRGIGASIVQKCIPITKIMIVISSSNKVQDITSDSCEIIPLQLDLTNYHNVFNIVSNTTQTISETKNIANLGVVLCGAQIGEYGGLFSSNLDDWDKLYKINVLGNLAIVKSCFDFIKSGIKTRIAFFAGGGSCYAYPFVGYSLSKTAVVRAVENVAIELNEMNDNSSIIAISPGAIKTEMLNKVIANGAEVRTLTDIKEPTEFVYNFLTDQFDSKKISGRLLHVRDNLDKIDSDNENMCKLRRIECR